jgi:SAM-dependent methyltransferase
MERPPDDPAARQAWLARWVVEQAEEGRIPQGESHREYSRFRHALARARMVPLRLQRRIARAAERIGDRILDRGLDTSGQAYEPEHDHPERVQYVPSPWHVLPRALHYLGVSEDDVFVDFGCGRGRVLHQAAKRPFRRVVGIEISPTLAETARRTLAAKRNRHRCSDVEVVVSDVTEFRVPDDMTIGYLFDPFKGEILDAVVRQIIGSIDRRPRRIRLIYVHPFYASQVVDTGRFRLLTEQRSKLLDTQTARTAIFESV